MAYQTELDKEIFNETIELSDQNQIIVSVYKYAEGLPKLSLKRTWRGTKTQPIGRITLSELNAILPMIDKAKVYMQ